MNIIKLLSEAIALGISELVVNLDSQLVVLQINGQYSIRKPQILRMYLCIRLLEQNFDYIKYHHIPRHMNTLIDALANYMLDRHLRNMLKDKTNHLYHNRQENKTHIYVRMFDTT